MLNNQDQAKKLLTQALSGHMIKDVAMRSGVAEQTIRNWLQGVQPGLGSFIAVVNATGHYLRLESE